MIKQKVKIKQPRMKADKTASITSATMLELHKAVYEELNELAYTEEEVTLIIVKDDEYADFLISESKKLLS